MKSSGDISAEPVRGQKFEEHVVTDLNLRNDENRPSLTSCAAAEKLQDVSSKNTIDELADAVTGGNGIGLWSSKLSEKCGNIGWKTKSHVPQHRKDRTSSRKCTTYVIRRQNHNVEVVERSWFCFSPSQTCVYCFTCRLMWTDTTTYAHFRIRKGTCVWTYAEPRLRLVADVINHCEELIQS